MYSWIVTTGCERLRQIHSASTSWLMNQRFHATAVASGLLNFCQMRNASLREPAI